MSDIERDEMIVKNMPLINYTINKYFSDIINKFSRDDLFQVGSIWLIHAVDNYDESKGRFDTYAVNCIRSKMKQYCMDNSSSIHISSRGWEKICKSRAKDPDYEPDTPTETLAENEDIYAFEGSEDPYDFVDTNIAIYDVIESLNDIDKLVVTNWLKLGGQSNCGSRKKVSEILNINIFKVKRILTNFRNKLCEAGIYG